jgi:NADH-quinone oxidoreductase subunit J
MTDDEPGSSSRKPGLAAVALFGVLAAVVLGSASGFSDPAAGFPAGESIIHNIGYALFDIDLGGIPSEGFLAAFLIIAIALDVALDSAVYLAKQEDEGRIISALTDGGQDIVDGEVAGTTETDETDRGGDR